MTLTVPLHDLPHHFILNRPYPPYTTRKKYVTVFEMKYLTKEKVSLTDTDIHSQFSGGTSSDHQHLAMTFYRRFHRDLYTCIPAGKAVITHSSRSLGTSVHCRISKCQVVPRHDMQTYGGNGNRTPLILSLGIRWKPRPGGFTPPPTEQEAEWDPTSMFKLGKRKTVTYRN